MYMRIRMHMVKVISLSNEAYEALKRRKFLDKSFSDVVMELSTKKKKSIMNSFGVLKGVTETLKSFEKAIKI